MQGLVFGQHSSGVFLLLVRQSCGTDVAFCAEVAGHLVELDLVGVSRAGSIRYSRPTDKIDQIIGLVERGAIGLGMPLPGLVAKIAPLFELAELRGIWLEGGQQIFAP